MASESKVPGKWIVRLALLIPLGLVALLWFQLSKVAERQSAMTSCYSDTFGGLKQHLEKYAANHQGNLPKVEELAAALDAKERDWYLTCHGKKQPLCWNSQLATIKLASSEKRLIAWCPEGAHGKYSGVILVNGGAIELGLVKAEELRELEQAEAKLLSVGAKPR
jgi:hypothetical protein